MRRFLISACAAALMTGAASAADIPMAEAPIAAAAPSIFTWSGFYVGVHAGGLWGGHEGDELSCDSVDNLIGDQSGLDGPPVIYDPDFSPPCERGHNDDLPFGSPERSIGFDYFDVDDDFVALTDIDDSDDGDELSWLGGAQIGINQQYGRFVVGLEADFSWLLDSSGEDSTSTFLYFDDACFGCGPDDGPGGASLDSLTGQSGTGTIEYENSLEWLSTFRARLGGALGGEGRLLVYGTGGLALAGVDSSASGTFEELPGGPGCDPSGDPADSCRFLDDDDDGNDYEIGFAIGAGAEYAFTNHLSLGVEYLYVGLDGDESQSLTFLGDDGRRFDVTRDSSLDDLHKVSVRLNWLFGPNGS